VVAAPAAQLAAPGVAVRVVPVARAVVAAPDAQVVAVARDASVAAPGVAVRAVPVARAVVAAPDAQVAAVARDASVVARDASVEAPDVAVRAAFLAQVVPAAAQAGSRVLLPVPWARCGLAADVPWVAPDALAERVANGQAVCGSGLRLAAGQGHLEPRLACWDALPAHSVARLVPAPADLVVHQVAAALRRVQDGFHRARRGLRQWARR
jgi:hypothetical protein